MDEESRKVPMLLDVENIFGDSSNRLGPILIFMCAALAPAFIYGYTGMYWTVPLAVFLPVWLLYSGYMLLVTLGHQPRRLKEFKRQRDNVYSLTYDMMNIKLIHEQGCIEYINGTIGFYVVTFNNTAVNPKQTTRMVRDFMKTIFGNHKVDTYYQNVTDTQALEDRYSHIKLFKDSGVAEDFVEIIDFNRKLVESSSLLVCTVHLIKGSKSDWKDIVQDIQNGLRSNAAKCFKIAYMATDSREIEKLLSRDINGEIYINAMLQKKYFTGQYYGSTVTEYVPLTDDDLKPGKVGIDADFMPAYENEEISNEETMFNDNAINDPNRM